MSKTGLTPALLGLVLLGACGQTGSGGALASDGFDGGEPADSNDAVPASQPSGGDDDIIQRDDDSADEDAVDDDIGLADDDTQSDDDMQTDDDAPVDDDTIVDDDLVPGDDDTIADDDVLPGDASVPPDDGGADDDATDAGPEPEPSLPVGNPPMVQINHPGDGEVRDPCPDGFPFVAIATDTEDGDLAPDLDWTSSIDGPIGTGSSFDTCLSPGVHTVAASVEDSDGNIGTDAVTLTITGPVTPGGADPANDDFERGALGPDWEVIFPTSGNQVQVFDGALGMGPGPQGFFLVNWVASDFEADQYSEATMPDDVDPDWLHQPYVRWRPSDGARYGFGYNGDPVQATLGEWYFKYDGVSPADTRIIASTPAASVPGPGDVLRVEVEGWVLRGYFNDLLVLEATDTDPSRISTGRPGLAARWATGNTQTTDSVKVYESWSGGSL